MSYFDNFLDFTTHSCQNSEQNFNFEHKIFLHCQQLKQLKTEAGRSRTILIKFNVLIRNIWSPAINIIMEQKKTNLESHLFK